MTNDNGVEIIKGPDMAQVPLEEYERLRINEMNYLAIIDKGTSNTLYDLRREIFCLKRQVDKCNTCPYKQMVKTLKAKV